MELAVLLEGRLARPILARAVAAATLLILLLAEPLVARVLQLFGTQFKEG